MKAYITIGVSASGKTTWAKEWAKTHPRTLITNRDDMRFSVTGYKGWLDYKWNNKVEDIITNLQHTTIKEAAALGWDVIIADTNLNPKFRQDLIGYCEDLGFHVELKEFEVSFEEACKRDAARPNGVGYSVIAKQMKFWNEYKGVYTYIPNPTLPDAIIVDLDGTLAHMITRTAFQWERVGEDSLDKAVATTIEAMKLVNDVSIIIMSGRDEVCRDITEHWLHDNGVEWDKLLMRPKGDMRRDSEVKLQLFKENVASKYNVLYAIDDRPQVVRLWNDIGVKVFNVGVPHIEF